MLGRDFWQRLAGEQGADRRERVFRGALPRFETGLHPKRRVAAVLRDRRPQDEARRTAGGQLARHRFDREAGARVAFSPDAARELKQRSFDLPAMRSRGYAYEKLDQLTMELLLGVR